MALIMSLSLRPSRFVSLNAFAASRKMSSSNLNRPAPPPLPKKDQREFEELVRKAQSQPTSVDSSNRHPDAPQKIKAEFDGDVNPVTGEQGGPKREPVGRWTEDAGGDWSFKGRVSDF